MTGLLLMGLLAVMPVAQAQDCPAGARQGERIPRSSRVRVLAVHPDDAYASNPSSVIGRVGVTTEGWTSDSCWYTGSFREANGEERYFFKVAVADASRTAITTGGVPCPPEAHASAPLEDGTQVKLVAVHREDPLYPEWVRLVGTTGSIRDHTPRGSCWMSGTVRTDDGTRITFERGAVWLPEGPRDSYTERNPQQSVADLSMGSDDAPIAFDGPRIPRGQRLRILTIDPSDAYYPEREDIEGLRCTSLEVLRRNERGWFTGEVRCDDRRNRYFLKVGVQLLPF